MQRKTDPSRLGAMLAEIGDVALIIIDPITAYLGGVETHYNADVRAALAPLSDLAAAHGAAVLCVSHLNKDGNTEALMRVTGSIAFVAAARAAYLVAKYDENAQRRLFLPLKIAEKANSRRNAHSLVKTNRSTIARG